MRNPVDKLTHGLPRPWRVAIDWVVTIVGAVAIVLAIKQWVVNPYRIPSSSMEPTLHCAGAGLGCTSRFSDRVLANRFIYHFKDPARGDIVVFETPPAVEQHCSGGGDVFVKRLIGLPEHRVVALTPQGRQLDQGVVDELAGEEHLTLLSARFEGFDERILAHLANDAISIGPYVLSGGELPAMVVADAVARRLPGALSEGSGAEETFSAELEGGFEYPQYTRPAEFRGWTVPEILLSGDHARIAEWRREQSRLRSAGAA